MDTVDRLILDHIQGDFPVESRPYEAIAEALNRARGLAISGREVWERVLRLREGGYIRRLGAVFNANKLGYRSTLCAAKVPQPQIAAFAELVNAYPQVTHNYVRSDDLNVWFTFSSDRPEALEDFIRHLKEASGVDEIYEMDALKLFKINAVFKLNQA